ncbi:hypothetical protein AMTRI_Chr03g53330 [Amborella trichopoda]|uniref:rRNA adenine N(6)-methyltransferase n=1 Tax=Amborella trichopoda TaxID=13333 RepID=W1P2T0_AMBTC|nr:hypothetical protein AMTR_s00002p00244930 [Amborella trichopoda]
MRGSIFQPRPYLLLSHTRLRHVFRSFAKLNTFDPFENESQEGKGGKDAEAEEEPLYLHRSRGQHLLTNQRVLDAIVGKAGVERTDTVLEIGPGTGNLTLTLLHHVRHVIAVEIDQRMIRALNSRASMLGLAHQLTVISGDALKTQFPPFDLCVANIPYGISSPLIAKLLFDQTITPFRNATLLLQKEFASRLLARPGDSAFNRLAVNVQLVAHVQHLMGVSKRDFVPCPKVDSSLVKIVPNSVKPNVDLKEWWAFTRTCFCKKNKTLGAIFRQKKKVLELMKRRSMVRKGGNDECGFVFEDDESEDDGEEGEGVEVKGGEVSEFKEKVLSVLKDGGYEDKRPSKLSIDQFLHLLTMFNNGGIRFHG